MAVQGINVSKMTREHWFAGAQVLAHLAARVSEGADAVIITAADVQKLREADAYQMKRLGEERMELDRAADRVLFLVDQLMDKSREGGT